MSKLRDIKFFAGLFAALAFFVKLFYWKGKREGKKEEHAEQVEESHEISQELNKVNQENIERETKSKQSVEDRLADGDIPDIE